MAFFVRGRVSGRNLGLVILIVVGIVSLLAYSCKDSSPVVDRERMLREKAEQEYRKAHEEMVATKQRMGVLLGAGIAGSAVALIVGTALGSKARRDAKKPREEVNPIDGTGKSP